MGACDISFTLDGKLSPDKVRQAFLDKKKENEEYNGHREGYSGDFQTVDWCKITDEVFNSYNEAFEYCLNNAEKWSHVIAVRYKTNIKVKPDKKLKKLRTQYKKISRRLAIIENKYNRWYNGIKTKRQPLLDKKKTAHCVYCKSTLNLTYRRGRFTCPVCGMILITKSQYKRYKELRKDIDKWTKLKNDLGEKIDNVYNKLREQAAEQSTETEWLVAGWGAC